MENTLHATTVKDIDGEGQWWLILKLKVMTHSITQTGDTLKHSAEIPIKTGDTWKNTEWHTLQHTIWTHRIQTLDLSQLLASQFGGLVRSFHQLLLFRLGWGVQNFQQNWVGQVTREVGGETGMCREGVAHLSHLSNLSKETKGRWLWSVLFF